MAIIVVKMQSPLLTLAVNRGSFSDDTPSGPGPIVNVQCETESSCITLNGSNYGKVVTLVNA